MVVRLMVASWREITVLLLEGWLALSARPGRRSCWCKRDHLCCCYFNGGMKVRGELLLLMLLSHGAEKMTMDTAKEDLSLLLKVRGDEDSAHV